MSFDDYDERLNTPEYEVEDVPETVDLITEEDTYQCGICKDKVCICDVTPEDSTPTITSKEQEFEKIKQKLRDEQENEYENPDKIYVDIDIPSKGKVGEECIVKLSKKVPVAEFALSEKLSWKKKDKFDRFSKEELCASPFKIEQLKDVDEVKFKWEELDGRGRNMLKSGEYFLEISARSKNAREETTARRIIRVEK
jgi:predicted PilT family ATPase